MACKHCLHYRPWANGESGQCAYDPPPVVRNLALAQIADNDALLERFRRMLQGPHKVMPDYHCSEFVARN